jgi:uncharacterized membrane protein
MLHRWLGRLYLGVGVVIGGISGAVLASQAYGGPWSRAGFLGLALAWLATGAVAWHKIRHGDVEAHRRWMVRNFGLSLAAVSLRLGLPALVAGGVTMPVAYPFDGLAVLAAPSRLDRVAPVARVRQGNSVARSRRGASNASGT